MSTLQRETLPPDIEQRLNEIEQGDNADLQRRARLIRRWHEGATQADIANEAGMSVSGVKYWLRLYREKGISIFDSDSPDTATAQEAPISEPAAEPEPAFDEPAPEPIAEMSPPEPPPKRRGRPLKAAAPPPEPPAPEPEPIQEALPELEPSPEPVFEPIAEAPVPEPPPKRRGRPPKAAAPPPEPELEPEVEVAVPPKRRGRPPKAAAPPPEPEPPKRRGRPPKALEAIEPIPAPEARPEPVFELEFEPELEQAPTVELAPPDQPEWIEPPDPAQTLPEPIAEPQPTPSPVITSVTGLVDYYKIDLNHARHVADQALALFDATAEIHRLPDKTRGLLEAGALLHNVAYELDQENHHLRGRDIILETPLRGLSEDERQMVALLAAFHRKRVHPEREAAYMELPAELRSDTLTLAALLRIADGSDHSQTQTTTITDVQVRPGELTILVEGENCDEDALRMQKKADLWEQQFSQQVRVRSAADSEPHATVRVMTTPPALRDRLPDLVITLDPSMTSIRALRRLAVHYTERLERLTAQVRSGEDQRLPLLAREIDRLGGLLGLTLPEQFDQELGWLAQTTHDAQIAVTLYERAESLADDTDDPNAPALSAHLTEWKDAARRAFTRIDFARVDRLIADLRSELAADPPEDSGALINTLIGPTVWTQLTDLRDVMERGESVTDALVAVRRLQDYLLYFRSLLGPEAIQALDLIVPFESFLTTIYLIQSMLNTLGSRPAAEIMRNRQMDLLNELADGLPGAWAGVNSATFRRALALALATP